MHICEALRGAQCAAQHAQAVQMQASACNQLFPVACAGLLDIAVAPSKGDVVHLFFTRSLLSNVHVIFARMIGDVMQVFSYFCTGCIWMGGAAKACSRASAKLQAQNCLQSHVPMYISCACQQGALERVRVRYRKRA